MNYTGVLIPVLLPKEKIHQMGITHFSSFQKSVQSLFQKVSPVVLLMAFYSTIHAQSGVEEVPLNYNPVLEAMAESSQNDFQGRSDVIQINIDVPSGGSVEYCFENPFFGELLDSLGIEDCTDLNWISASLSDECVVISAQNTGGAIQSDTLCVILKGSEGTIQEYQLLVRIRPIRSLPFVDDFSYEGPFPHPEYWTDRKVFINNTLGMNPPSIGTATFDGLSERGRPYGGAFGPADFLTSAFINMNSAIAGQCFLTFFIQAGGRSYVPPASNDLVLEFRTEEGEWEEIDRWSPNDYPVRDSFYFISIPVQSGFFHDAFQFRFYNLTNGIGMNSNWHLNYVKLANEFQADLIFENDIAFTMPPRSVLQRYSAMPLRQFISHERDELATELEINIFNHFNGVRQADPSLLLISEEESGNILLNETLLEVPPVVPTNQRDLPPGRHRFSNEIQNPNDFFVNTEITTSAAEDEMIIRKTYSFEQNEEQIPELRRNNSVSSETVIGNYFAYDDGTAERAINIFYGSGARPMMAVQYKNNVGDSLRGIAINLPRVRAGDGNKRFRLMVWGASLDDEPLYESGNLNPRFVDTYHDSIQGFTTFAIRSAETGEDEAIYIPPGNFYVGWMQVSTGNTGVYVGFDRNSPDKTEYVFFSDGARWQPIVERNPNLQGAVMIRPIFSDEPVVQTSVRETALGYREFTPFPNPARNTLFWSEIEGLKSHFSARVYSLSGGELLMQADLSENQIDISKLPVGSYLIELRSDRENVSHFGKFIKQ